ncbi:MAG: hypothetical protein Q9167_002708 [Letrouitia subvulpina]
MTRTSNANSCFLKTGKKKIKAVARALRSINQSPRTPGRQRPTNLLSTVRHQSFLPVRSNSTNLQIPPHNLGPTPISTPVESPRREEPVLEQTSHGLGQGEGGVGEGRSKVSPINIKESVNPQASSQPWAQNSSTAWDSGAVTNYGSILSSTPSRNHLFGPPSLELPDPALPPDEEAYARHNRAWRQSRLNPNVTPIANQNLPPASHPYEVGQTLTPPRATSSLLPKRRNIFKNRRTVSTPGIIASPGRPRFLRRIFSTNGTNSPITGDVPLSGYTEFDNRQAEFTKFLDSQLDKIESFYKMKEKQANQRLAVLRQQLHEMRDRRMEEVLVAQRAKERNRREQGRLDSQGTSRKESRPNGRVLKKGSSAHSWLQPLENAIGVGQRFGKNTKALAHTGSPPGPNPHEGESQHQVDRRDFTRRPVPDDVPYRSAKRKLRLALQEFYRGLELLKSYALLNRTAFRKINKKYDKVVKARPTGRYMSEKVNKAWFVQSEVLEGLIVAVEDLYARYFERGNHKVAVGKLRSKSSKAADYTGSVFRNGLLLAGGAVFGVQGLVYGADHLTNPDPVAVANTSYLLQVRLLIWARAKINYAFIFEFDSRHTLDWRQLSEFRLLLAGIYPVEFRDFFLGDMYCSQTYAMGNIELFFCLYARGWHDPTQCNSSHSRLLGFFTTVPGIWRALQCLRRYYDTRNSFPHLVNCGKYTFTILFGMALSIYRIDRTFQLKALFITVATINSIYCYPILRFNWIFYAIFSNELQHSALLSFMVALSEVCRRGMWTLFRVENEHCTNVGRFRASRDFPLPYDLPSPIQSSIEESRDQSLVHPVEPGDDHLNPTLSSIASGAQPTPGIAQTESGFLRRRHTGPPRAEPTPVQRGIARVGTIMTQAHVQDFERKRRPGGTPLERQATYESREGDKRKDDVDPDSSSEDEVEGEERDEEGEEERIGIEDILERRRSAVE